MPVSGCTWIDALCELLADLSSVRNAAIMVRRNGGVLAECPEWDGHIAHPVGEC